MFIEHRPCEDTYEMGVCGEDALSFLKYYGLICPLSIPRNIMQLYIGQGLGGDEADLCKFHY